jgi:hypothetical protein
MTSTRESTRGGGQNALRGSGRPATSDQHRKRVPPSAAYWPTTARCRTKSAATSGDRGCSNRRSKALLIRQARVEVLTAG